MVKLTNNFSLEELYHSNTAKSLGIDNTPNSAVSANLKLLAENILQPLRDKVGAVNINCAYRCKTLNEAVGGAITSQHLTGNAADISTADKKAAFIYIQNNLPFDQLIWENGDDKQPDWIHVSYSERNRREVLRKIKGGGYVKFKAI